MKIIEQLCMGKRAGTPCEDGWVVTPHFAAVIDGSTAKIPLQPGEESPGHYAMRHVSGAIAMLPPDATKEEALQQLTRAIGTRHPYASRRYRPTCSAVIYSRQRREVWMIGDCQCRLQGRTFTNEKQVDRILIDIRCRVVRHFLQNGYTPDDIRRDDKGRAFIYAALREQVHFQNDPNPHNPYRYSVIDGTPIDPDTVPCLTADGISEIILATDGYTELHDTLDETERALRDMLREDPLCIGRNPSTKCLVEGNRSFDDRTYLRIALT